jgi:hypothetical protein
VRQARDALTQSFSKRAQRSGSLDPAPVPKRHTTPPLVLLALSGCPADDDGLPACIDFDAQACTPLFEPTFDEVHEEVLAPRCALAGGSCHGNPDADGAENGFVITDADATHSVLLDGFVEPGDPSCSLLMVRLNVDDPDELMPPGTQPLDESTRCSIAQWIAAGAER